jgi:hypothetical protein
MKINTPVFPIEIIEQAAVPVKKTAGNGQM